MALPEYKRAVELQPGYVTAWNNLGDAHEKLKDWGYVRVCVPVCMHPCTRGEAHERRPNPTPPYDARVQSAACHQHTIPPS
jgi:hypothetical protein